MEGHVCMYMDGILIFTDTLEEYQFLLQTVLKHLQQHQLYLCPEKCKFKQTKVEYLRLILSYSKVEMDPVKVLGVMDWPTPVNWKEVQAFLGFATSTLIYWRVFTLSVPPIWTHKEGSKMVLGRAWAAQRWSKWLEGCKYVEIHTHGPWGHVCIITFIIIYVYLLYYCYVQLGSSGSTTIWTHCIVTAWKLHHNSHNLLSTTVTTHLAAIP